jgi:hypothetical protein
MDLNDLYFRHQISLMRANTAPDDQARGAHQGRADELAQRIGMWQQRVGASAASMWNVLLHRSDVPAGAVS